MCADAFRVLRTQSGILTQIACDLFKGVTDTKEEEVRLWMFVAFMLKASFEESYETIKERVRGVRLSFSCVLACLN